MYNSSDYDLLIIGILTIFYFIPAALCIFYSFILFLEDILPYRNNKVMIDKRILVLMVDLIIAFIPALNFQIGYHIYQNEDSNNRKQL